MVKSLQFFNGGGSTSQARSRLFIEFAHPPPPSSPTEQNGGTNSEIFYSRFFHDCKNIQLICLISAAVTYKDYHSQSDRLNS